MRVYLRGSVTIAATHICPTYYRFIVTSKKHLRIMTYRRRNSSCDVRLVIRRTSCLGANMMDPGVNGEVFLVGGVTNKKGRTEWASEMQVVNLLNAAV